ncbi:MAG: radical SAM-associated putative lipoprotein [Paludibacteraceae bacterium]|nr:radical SAM-associated putative lipoprotein [Paludibacteraceae bacterium]
MKKLNRKLLRSINQCIAFILSLISIASFQSCVAMYGTPPPELPDTPQDTIQNDTIPTTNDTIPGNNDNDSIPDIPVAYGTPTAEFHISGRVENRLGKSVRGIRISFLGDDSADITDKDGSFQIDDYDHWPDKKIMLIANDIDANADGHYKTDTIRITPKYERDPNNSWNQIANIDNVVITLEEEKDNNNE